MFSVKRIIGSKVGKRKVKKSGSRPDILGSRVSSKNKAHVFWTTTSTLYCRHRSLIGSHGFTSHFRYSLTLILTYSIPSSWPVTGAGVTIPYKTTFFAV